MKKHRRLLSIVLAAVLALSLALPVFAADGGSAGETLTRGTFVVRLFQMSGAEDTEAAQALFADVPAEGELAQAVRWAAEQGIAGGYGNGNFGPNDPLTREQMVTMLYRNAQVLGQAPAGEWMFPLGNRDADAVAPWADKAMQWAVMNRILPALEGNLAPKENATEEQFAAVLNGWQRFLTPVGESRGILILYTSDVHCGIDQNYGYAGLWEAKNALTAQGYDVILVEDGDSIQGEPIGTLTKGAALTALMDTLGYGVAIPGNHEYDYGMEAFLSLAEQASYPYISCNFMHNGEPVFQPYVIRELGGKQIAFVGVTTPQTITSSTPTYFQNENGEYVYSFLQEDTGENVYNAIQTAADSARAEGADYVVVLAHLGNEAECIPWTYADVISHTTGIDVLLDGHSHDTDQIIMKNADGKQIPRSACGTKLACIGWCSIDGDGTVTTGLYSWDREESAQKLLALKNPMTQAVAQATDELNEKLNEVVAHSGVTLTTTDPEAVDSNGKPIRIVRRMETNLGDLCADAFRQQAGADIGFFNGGGIRVSIAAGDITRNNILSVMPFGNGLCMVEATGRQIVDALEWGARAVPSESGGFLQVSGLTYEIHSYIPSSCVADENGLFASVAGERRVKNVIVGDQPIQLDKTYKLACHNYLLLSNGDGYTMFDGDPLLLDCVKLDNQLLIDYIVDVLGGEIGAEYADPYGQGRITIVETAD